MNTNSLARDIFCTLCIPMPTFDARPVQNALWIVTLLAAGLIVRKMFFNGRRADALFN